MPADRPGTLSRQKIADILAYIFAVNKFPAGGGNSAPKARRSNRFDSRQPSAPGRQSQSAPRAAAAVTSSRSSSNAEPAPATGGRSADREASAGKERQPARFPEQTRAPYHASAPFKVTTLIDNLPAPWSLAFLPGGKILLTERLPGSIRILDTKGVLSEPVAGVADLASPAAKDIGLLDVVLDPKFATNHRIFFSFFDFIDGTNSNTYVARARLDEAKCALSDAKVIFRAQPAMPSKRLGGKTGGRIAIAPDGSLFVTIGDRSDSPPWDVAQRLDNHLGKIIHITPEARPRPTIRSSASRASCLRSGPMACAARKAWHSIRRTGRLWENEHGPRGGDELNIIEKGKNYGWPVIVHGIDYPGTADRRRHHAQGRHGGAGVLLGSGDRALRPRFLYRHLVSAMARAASSSAACAA